MAGPAWVRWFPERFRAATAAWTASERLLYRELLDHQAVTGSVPSDPERRAAVARMDRADADRAWETVREKFAELDSGGLANPTMAEERARSMGRSAELAEAGRRGARSRWDGRAISQANGRANSQANSQATSQANSQAVGLAYGKNENENKNTNPPPPPLEGGRGAGEDVERMIEAFGELYLQSTGRTYQAGKPEERAAREVLRLAGGVQEALARARRLLSSKDQWECQNASLRTLEARWAKFAEAAPGVRDLPPWGPLTRETWLAQAVDRHRKAIEDGDAVRARKARLEVEDRARVAGLPNPTLPERTLSEAERQSMSRWLPNLANQA